MAKSKKEPTQNVENIGGQVIQAGGNVTINEKSSKTVGEKIAIWVSIVVGVVTIITAIVKFQDWVSPARHPESDSSARRSPSRSDHRRVTGSEPSGDRG